MRYRTLSPTGDYVFGQGSGEFLVNSPAAVAQAVQTRLALAEGEWFLNVTEGTPWAAEVLGTGTQPLYDQAIRQRILETQGVTGIAAYASYRDPATRRLTVACTINTQYGQAPVQQVL